MVIGEELRQGGLDINVELSVKRALLHDIEESHSGDFIRTFKHSDPALCKAIDQASEKFAKSLLKEASPKTYKVLYDLWKHAKDQTLEGMLTEFADFLSVLAYVLRESQMGNKGLLQENSSSLGEYSSKFLHTRYDFLREYIKEAQKLLFKEIQ